MVKWPNNRKKENYEPPFKEIRKIVVGEVKKYIEESPSKIAILEYPEMSTTYESTYLVKMFFQFFFEYIKELELQQKILCST